MDIQGISHKLFQFHDIYVFFPSLKQQDFVDSLYPFKKNKAVSKEFKK